MIAEWPEDFAGGKRGGSDFDAVARQLLVRQDLVDRLAIEVAVGQLPGGRSVAVSIRVLQDDLIPVPRPSGRPVCVAIAVDVNFLARPPVECVVLGCLDRLILFGERSLRNAVREYLVHYHTGITRVSTTG